MLRLIFSLLPLLVLIQAEAVFGVPLVPQAYPQTHSKTKPRYEVVSNPGARPGYGRIQDAIEAARAEGASSTHPAIIAIEAGNYEEDLVLYDGIEIEGPDGEPLDLADLDCLDSPLVQIAGIHALPREGVVHLKNLTLQLHPSNSGSNQEDQRAQNDKTVPRSLVFPPTTRTDPALTNSGGGGSGIVANNHSVLVGAAGNAIASLPVASNGQILIGSNGIDPVWAVPTDSASIVWSTGPGTLSASVVGGGTINSVVGTANRITVNTVASVATVDISSAYIGQTSITTLGTIASGTWNGTVISPTYGGTGVNNGTNTLTLAGNLATVGAFSSTFTMTNATAVTFPTTGTLATTSQIPTGAPLTSGDDTNVTLTLGGSPATALVNAASITAGWTGTLATSRGGLGGATTPTTGTILTGTGTAWTATTATYPATTTANQLLYSSATNTIAGLATANDGVLTTSGAGVPSISSTLPTAVQGNITSLGTIASGTWNGTVISPTYGGTGVNNGTNTLTLAGNLATAGAFSSVFTMTNTTAVTFPTTGTLATTAQIPTLPVSLANGGTGASLTASNGGIFYSTATAGAILAGTATANQVLLSGSTAAPSWSTATYPATTTANQLLYSSATNTIAGLATANDGVLITSGAGVPSISSTLPTAVQGNITSLGTIASGTWNGTVISPTYGGTGVNNGTNTLTLAGNLATVGAFSSTFTMTNTTTVTFPTTGTLATTSQIPTGAPLTSGDDTNVTLTLGGSPATALVNAASITAGWTGTLATSRGGLGGATTPTTSTILTGTGTAWTATTATYPATTTINQLLYSSAANTVTGLATANNGILVTSAGGVPSISTTLPSGLTGAALTKTDDTNVTLTLGGSPTTALVNAASITAGWTGQLSLARGGTNANLTASNGGIFYSTATAGAILAGTATAGQMLRSGANAAPTWSTATFPSTATGTGTILRADGTNWVATTATYPATTTANQLLYSSATNTVAGLASAANGTLVTDGSSVPSISSTLPSAVQNNITAVNSAANTLSIGGSVKTFTTGAVNVPSMTNVQSYTPTIAFGGASVGVTYSSNTGVYHTTTMPNGAVFVNFWGSIVLSNKGSSVGNLSITIPVATTNGSPYQFSVNGGNFSAGAGTQLYGNVNNSGSIAVINFMGNGLANAAVTNATTANNSTLVFWGSYWTQ